ncbi:MAG: serine/threonine-protein kinase, partial [bacterium]
MLEQLKTAIADRYDLKHEIGRGGMATVYLAHDVRHDRWVAVKVIRPEFAGSLGSERFLREIRFTAKLNHRGIVPLFDSGDADGVLYYVMPFVEGESLRDRLAREPRLPIDECLQLATDVAEALAYANDLGVIHRDVKPANIMLTPGHASIADFGIAKAVAEAADQRMTETGVSVGTPTYMSPEQLNGDVSIDNRSDQYSLACVVFEMLTGVPPFAGATLHSVVAQHMLARPPSVRDAREGVSPALSGALQRALGKSPKDRFARWSDFIDALRPGSSDRLLTRERKQSAFLAIAVLGAIALAWLTLGGHGVVGRGEIWTLAIPFGVASHAWWRHRDRTDEVRRRPPLELPASFESGLYGGLIGGALGGLFIGVLYVWQLSAERSSPGIRWMVAETFLVGTLAGAVFGASILLGVSWFRRASSGRDLLHNAAADFGGAIAGGATGGTAVGILVALIFARRPLPPMSAGVLFPGVSFISAAVVAGSLLYDYRGRARRLAVPFVGGVVVTAFAVVVTA